MMSGRSSALQGNEKPTAHTSLDETAAMALRTLPVLLFLHCGVEPGLGLGMTVQAVPS